MFDPGDDMRPWDQMTDDEQRAEAGWIARLVTDAFWAVATRNLELIAMPDPTLVSQTTT